MLEDADVDLVVGAHLPAHVYVHVPFCASKCSYCDFASVAGATPETIATVAEGICSELKRWGASALPGVVETLYVGGGTPTHVAGETLRIVEEAALHLPLREGAEITVEANPESLSEQLASRLVDAGVTRLSLGVQSFDDGLLRLLGRPHDARTARAAASAAVDAGLNLSVDLMCGIPGQTMASWQETVDRALRTGATHMSVYPLTLEAGTPLAVACEAELVSEPDPDLAADMMVLGEDVLSAFGFIRYETANYAREGFESRHNRAYWTGGSYLGVGPAAHGMLDEVTARAIGLVDATTSPGSPGVGRVRYSQPVDPRDWLVGREPTVETLSVEEAEREDIMLGMRLSAGVSASRVERAGLGGIFTSLSDDGLVECVAVSDLNASEAHPRSAWRTTRRGWLLGNEVFGRIWGAR